MKRDRLAEIHFYEWRIGAWAISETRDRLDAAGRGIYRELLDHCYGQGKIPDDHEWICRRCACTQEQYEKAWKVISRHFPKIEDTGYRFNVQADLFRGKYFSYVEQQQANRSRRVNKPNKSKEMNNDGSTTVENNSNGGSTNDKVTLRNDKVTTIQQEPPNPHAPDGALSGEPTLEITSTTSGVVRPTVRPKKAKKDRTIEEIRSALGDRLPWWEGFWSAYPCHEGTKEAMEAYERKVHTRELAVEIYNGAKAYAAVVAQKRLNDPAFQPKYPQGWINAERWIDQNELPLLRQNIHGTTEDLAASIEAFRRTR